jgi:hypothetical protein
MKIHPFIIHIKGGVLKFTLAMIKSAKSLVIVHLSRACGTGTFFTLFFGKTKDTSSGLRLFT